MASNRFIVVLLSFTYSAFVFAQDCPLLIEPELKTVNDEITVNWTSVAVCPSDPVVQTKDSEILVDFNFGTFCVVVPPGNCGNNFASIGRLSSGNYTVLATGFDEQRTVSFSVLPEPEPVPALSLWVIAMALALFSIVIIQFQRSSQKRP